MPSHNQECVRKGCIRVTYVATFRATSANTGFFLFFLSAITPYCQTTTSSQVRQNYSPRWQPRHRLAACPCGPRTPTSRGFCLEGGRHVFLKEAEEKREARASLKDANPAPWPRSLQDELPPPQGSGGHSGPHGAALALEGTLTGALVERQALVPRRRPASL
ncbi:hypothetical protein QTO34_012781 [Cnephaeus nilssonii]|uniref:Uncharacterized protein n=1 Tax=Cnephaeus nilssonii TaxID=3371016 RepID=A0AA40LDA2_CNENI|nr:hypothetical protein QTO34_012781 [Eptesicus nilssonii]